MVLTNTTPVSFYLSIFPDRDSINENYVLTVNSNLGSQTFVVFVVDQDITNPSGFNIITDFSQNNPAYNNCPAEELLTPQI